MQSDAPTEVDPRKGWTHLALPEPFSIEKYDADTNLEFLVFENGNLLMGLDCLPVKERHAFIKYGFVREEERGNGVASGMLQFVTSRAKCLGIASIIVEYPEMADEPSRLLAALKERGFQLHSADEKRVLYRKAL